MSGKLAIEIPIRHLHQFTPLTDFDFVLAHLVNENTTYRNFYADQRLKGREVWLDNSLIELGYPLSKTEMLNAALLCNATHIIPPDWPEDPDKTCKTAIEMKGKGYKIIGVIHGRYDTQRMILHEYKQNDIIPSLPFRGDRSWYNSQKDGAIHFLGMNSLKEIVDQHPSSIDTKLPIKLALQNKMINNDFDKKSEEYTYGSQPFDLIETNLDSQQISLACYNIMKVRAALWTY